MTDWTPLLTGADADRALQVLADLQRPFARLAARLDSRTARATSRRARSLSSGLPGIALACAYADAVQPDRGWSELAERTLAAALETARDITGVGLFSGVAGLSWVTTHLLDDAGEGPIDGVDAIILDALTRGELPFDLVSGVAGIGVYALERLPRPSAAELARAAIRILGERADHTPSGITWKTPARFVESSLRSDHPDGYHNPGMAHGVAGVVGFLAAAVRRGFSEAVPLLEPAATWLWRHRTLRASARRSRDAWCVGAPGMALALHATGVALDDSRWTARALELARAAAQQNPSDANLEDASLCHGDAGVAHVFLRLYQSTGDPVLRDAARRPLRRLVRRGRSRRTLAQLAYQRFTPTGRRPAVVLGWLNGLAGVVLVLCAALCEAEPAWDRLLLASPGV